MGKKFPRGARLGLAVGIFLVAGGEHTVNHAAGTAPITVNSTLDSLDVYPGDGVCETTPGMSICTLRAAVMEANSSPGADVVRLPAGIYALSVALADPDTAAEGDLDITDDIALVGDGALDTIVEGADLIDSVFQVRHATAVFSGLTVQGGGHQLSSGGGINNDGTLVLNDSVIQRNVARLGGGVLNHGSLTATRTAFIDNGAPGGESAGGGIFNVGTADFVDVEFSTNRAFSGGAIFNAGTTRLLRSSVSDNNSSGIGPGSAIFNSGEFSVADSIVTGNVGRGAIRNDYTGASIVRNTTISRNTDGGGVINLGRTLLVNVTVTENASTSGVGGIYNDPSPPPSNTLTLINTIVANNRGGDCGGPTPVESHGHNLDSDGTCALNAQGDLPNTDPMLGSLADNGGLTRTHALLSGSPAIDAGDPPSCPATDQRGIARPQDGNLDGTAICDIGAFEVEGPPPATPSRSLAAPASPTSTVALPAQLPGTGVDPESGPSRGWVPVVAALFVLIPVSATFLRRVL